MDEWKQNHFNLFWSKMIGIYGKRWITEHGSEPSEVWCEALQRFSFERIKMAIVTISKKLFEKNNNTKTDK